MALAVPGATARPVSASDRSVSGKAQLRSRGYLVSHPVRLAAAKARAAARAGQVVKPSVTSPKDPIASPSFEGIFESDLAPPDTTGAVGDSSYVEFINLQIALYSRTGGLMSALPVEGLFGGVHFNYSDPQVLWDSHSRRFYVLIWDTTNATMKWAFSKTHNPATVTPADWCTFTSSFGYSPNDAPDYPKLGQTTDFLLIGVNFFANFQTYFGGELLTIQKPQVGSGSVPTCPPNTFGTHRFTDTRFIGAVHSNAPEPAQQADPSSVGYVTAVQDLTETPNSNVIALWKVTNNAGSPVLTGPELVTVPTFSLPPNAPQCASSNVLDTIDGRLEHAMSAGDGTFIHVWTSHAVAGGAGAEQRWYEIRPSSPPVLKQSGVATSPTLYVWNGSISSDRTVKAVAAHGSNMVMGFSTSSATQCPAIQMVSKVGTNPQSGFVLVKQSTVPDNDFSCSPCRWGDYSGASPDPGASLTAPTGMVWLSNQWVNGPNPGGTPNWRTWIWGATP
jgi:hypothetical protein